MGKMGRLAAVRVNGRSVGGLNVCVSFGPLTAIKFVMVSGCWQRRRYAYCGRLINWAATVGDIGTAEGTGM